MSDIKELNNEELKEVSGGDSNWHYTQFEKGDWIDLSHKPPRENGVYYIKEVLGNAYHVIEYNPTGMRKGRFSKYEKKDLGVIPQDNFGLFKKIEKPYWVTEDPSLQKGTIKNGRKE